MGSKQSKEQDPTILTQEAIELLMSNTQISKEEILKWHRNFLQDCPSGKLTKDVFKKVFSELMPGKNPNNLCEVGFKHFDQDGNGTIDFYEFMCALAASQSPDSITKWSNAFDMYDLNKNGQLDEKELRKVLKFICEAYGSSVDIDTIVKRMFESCGREVDKVINRNDFIGFVMNDGEFKQILHVG